MSYKSGFIYKRHNDLRDQIANMMSEMCKDAKIEPKLTPLSEEELQDIRTQGFWEQGQQTFYGLWVFDPNVCRYRNKSL